MAVVGDKRENGFLWLHNMEHFTGKVYSVQIDKEEGREIEALGYQNYSSLTEIPGPVDYVVLAVPRRVAPAIIRDCIQKKVGAVSLFTAGFAETGTEEGLRLQNTLQAMARESGLNLIGPNCMGIFNPALGVRHNIDQYYGQAGPVGFISQSGTQASLFSSVAFRHGLKVSKSVSYGNAIVLDAPDYLEYLLQDAQTKVIAMYIEGTMNGRRLMDTLRKVSAQKPVVIWKGGQTEAGARAIASHTASLTKSPAVWQTMFRQCGCLSVDGLDALVDVTKLCLYPKPPAGNRLALVAISGGESVAMTDAFNREGFAVPRLTTASYEKLSQMFHIIGGNYNNPVDISWTVPSLEMLTDLLSILDQDANIDMVVMELPVFFLTRMAKIDSGFSERMLGGLAAFQARATKPFITVLTPGPMEAEALQVRPAVIEKGLTTFPDFDRAARALRIMVERPNKPQD